jgi:hypothetical protein
MTTKLVLRLLDRDNALLGWTEVAALAKGDGALWATGPVQIAIERDGIPTTLSVHWADVHVEQRRVVEWPMLTIGTVVPIDCGGCPLFTVGLPPAYLAPVTVRGHVGVSVPVGGLGVEPV